MLLNLAAMLMFGFTVRRALRVSRPVGVFLTIVMVSTKARRPMY